MPIKKLKMKLFIITIQCVFLSLGCIGQTANNYGSLKFLKGNFTGYVINYISENRDSTIDNLCEKSVCFITFTISFKGEIDSIQCNANTPLALRNLFTAGIKSTQGYWKASITMKKKKQKQRFILPIGYSLDNKRCKIEDRTFESAMSIIDFSGKFRIDKYPFLSNNSEILNCILLSPVYFGSPIF